MHSSPAAGKSAIFSRPSGSTIIKSRRLRTSRARRSRIRRKHCFEEPSFMHCRGFAFFIFVALGALIAMPVEAADKVLRHIVMYKFKDDVTLAQVVEVVDAFAALPKKVNTIIGYEAGTNVSKEGKSDG